MSTRERTLLIIVGVLAVGALAWFLLFGGGGDEPEEAAPTPVTPPSPPPTEELPELPTRRPPRTFAFFGGRDPFVPLVEAEEGAGGTGTATAPTAPSDGTVPSDGETPSDGFQPTNGAGGGGAPVTMGGREVVLIDIFTRGGQPVAQVSVEGQTFVVGEGNRFAGNFEVTNIEGTCATFLFGDESFTLCEGESPK